jgi:formaldehyde-activating enzyme involved in methanogenesis
MVPREKYVFESYNNIPDIVLMLLCFVIDIGYVYFLVISIGVAIYSESYRNYGLIGFCVTVFVIFLNLFMASKVIVNIKFNKRYGKYKNLLRYRNIQIIEDLSSYAGVEQSRVLKDLKKAVKENLIPQGHFGRNNIIFIVSDEVYNKYMEKQAVYDRYYRKQLEDRARMKGRTKEISKIMEMGQEYIDKIHDSNEIIKDKVISQKLDRMENVVSMIFHEVDVNPKQADKLGLFLNYYLPTTEKLLEAYIDIDEKGVKGETLDKTKLNIEKSLDTINSSFEGILDRFYQEQDIDIASDISAMEIMMKQEGLANSIKE